MSDKKKGAKKAPKDLPTKNRAAEELQVKGGRKKAAPAAAPAAPAPMM